MKNLIIFLAIVSSSPAFALYHCDSSDQSTKLDVNISAFQGYVALFESKEVERYYQNHHQIQLGSLETITDPDKHSMYVSRVYKNAHGLETYSFLQKSNATEALWSLEFLPETGIARLTGGNGKRFEFRLRCQSTGDLE